MLHLISREYVPPRSRNIQSAPSRANSVAPRLVQACGDSPPIIPLQAGNHNQCKLDSFASDAIRCSHGRDGNHTQRDVARMIFFDDIEVGAVRTVGEYRVPEPEIIEFALKWDPQPFHTDAEAARATQFGGITASSAHVFCIVSALFNRLDPIALICGLKNEFTMRMPVYGGDRLSLFIGCEEKRASNSKRDRGIARFTYHLDNQNGEIVADGSVSFMVRRAMDGDTAAT